MGYNIVVIWDYYITVFCTNNTGCVCIEYIFEQDAKLGRVQNTISLKNIILRHTLSYICILYATTDQR